MAADPDTAVLVDARSGQVVRRLMAAGVRDGLPYTAVCTDQGKTWRTIPVPAPGSELHRVRIEFSVTGDLWLFGHVLDVLAFPRLWRYEEGQWVPEAARGHPEHIAAMAPLGPGMLAVTGPSGSGVVTGGYYNDLGWPLGGNNVSVLEDGTVFSVHPDGSVRLGEGWGAQRRWITLTLIQV